MRVNSPAACPSASPFRARAVGTRRRILESLRERERSVNERVEGLDAPRVMVWRWEGGGIDTTVRFECSPEREGTRLTLTHDGFRGVGPRLVGMILSRGWATMLAGAPAKEIASDGR